jgi:hypothetical protein
VPILWMSPRRVRCTDCIGPFHNADGPGRWRDDLSQGYDISWDLSRVEVARFGFGTFKEPEMRRFESAISEACCPEDDCEERKTAAKEGT